MKKEYTSSKDTKFCPVCGSKVEERLFDTYFDEVTGEKKEIWQKYCPKKVKALFFFSEFCWEAHTIYSGD